MTQITNLYRKIFLNFNTRGVNRLRKIYKSSGNSVTIQDLYILYSYKTRDVNSKTVPVPYFPKDQITNHPVYSITYKEYKRIISIYLEIILERLFKGEELEFPSSMGKLCLEKIKYRFKDYHKTMIMRGSQKNKDKPVYQYYKHLETQGYSILTRWSKKGVKTRFAYLWQFRISKRTYNKYFENYILNNKIPITNFKG